MRVGLVVGKVSLKRVHPSLLGKKYVLVRAQSLAGLLGEDQSTPEETVVLDELGALPGTRIGFSEGAEAAAPYVPEKKPVSAYAACIIDDITLNRESIEKLRKGAR